MICGEGERQRLARPQALNLRHPVRNRLPRRRLRIKSSYYYFYHNYTPQRRLPLLSRPYNKPHISMCVFFETERGRHDHRVTSRCAGRYYDSMLVGSDRPSTVPQYQNSGPNHSAETIRSSQPPMAIMSASVVIRSFTGRLGSPTRANAHTHTCKILTYRSQSQRKQITTETQFLNHQMGVRHGISLKNTEFAVRAPRNKNQHFQGKRKRCQFSTK